MSAAAQQVVNYLEMLPADDQNFALEFIKKLVLAWDPDFSKLTAAERRELEKVRTEDEVSYEAINWD